MAWEALRPCRYQCSGHGNDEFGGNPREYEISKRSGVVVGEYWCSRVVAADFGGPLLVWHERSGGKIDVG